MTKGPWKYKKAHGHHHVLFPDGEVLDVQNESDARLIALVPEMIEDLLWIYEYVYSNDAAKHMKTIRRYK